VDENNKVSIIVVNWNGERFLNDCLGTLSGQTLITKSSWLIMALPTIPFALQGIIFPR
jgi:hypothetical protein